MAGSKDFDNTVIKNRSGGPQLQCGKGLQYVGSGHGREVKAPVCHPDDLGLIPGSYTISVKLRVKA